MRAWVVIRGHRLMEPPAAHSSTLTAVELVDGSRLTVEGVVDEILSGGLEDGDLLRVDAEALARATVGTVRSPTRAWVQGRHAVGLIVADDEAAPGEGAVPGLAGVRRGG